jgi:putative phage-type endonuclease
VPPIYGAPPSGDAFTDRRRTGVGGSDAGAILGVSPWLSRLGCWEEKRGIRGSEIIPSERMIWGNRLQSAILAGYGEDHGVRTSAGRFRRSEAFPFVIGHPDGFAEARREPYRAPRIVEVKAVAMMDEQWGEPGSDAIPPQYYAQVQHYMVLAGYAVADLTALIGGRELRTFEIPRNPAFIDAMLDEEEGFWRLVEHAIPPEPDGSEDAGKALRALYPRAIPEEIPASGPIAEVVALLLDAKERAKLADAEAERHAQTIQAFMGARERLLVEGAKVTWTNRAGSTSWKSVAEAAEAEIRLYAAKLPEEDREALLSALAGLPERFRGKPSRVFTAERKAAAA